MVGLAGFEPATSRPPDERATKLRYSPTRQRETAWHLRVDVRGPSTHCKSEKQAQPARFSCCLRARRIEFLAMVSE